jgi:hypothetical protein
MSSLESSVVSHDLVPQEQAPQQVQTTHQPAGSAPATGTADPYTLGTREASRRSVREKAVPHPPFFQFFSYLFFFLVVFALAFVRIVVVLYCSSSRVELNNPLENPTTPTTQRLSLCKDYTIFSYEY